MNEIRLAATVATSLLISLYVAYEFQRYRWALERTNLDLRGYQDVVEHANELIQCLTPAGHFVYVNAAWRRVLGYHGEEIHAFTLLSIVHPDSRARVHQLF